MPYGLIRNETLLAKIEASYGVDSVPVEGTDAVFLNGGADFGFDRLRLINRSGLKATLGPFQGVYGGSMKAVRFEAELKGSGTAGTAPEIGPLLRACGLGETIVALTSVTYAPVSTGFESVTLYFFEFGRVRHILLGARGSASIRWAAGQMPICNFEMIGRIGTVTDQTQPAPTFNQTVPQGVLGLDARVGGVQNLVVQSFELDMGVQIEVPDNVNDSEGYGNVLVTDRDPTLTLQRHAELVATIDPWNDLRNSTERAFVSGNLGATAGNIVNLNANQMHYRDIAPGESENVRTESFPFGLHESASGDDQFEIVFT